MLFSPLLRPQVRAAMPIPVNYRESIMLEIEGFSEYAAEVSPSQRAEIEKLAGKILRSNMTADPMYEFRIEGHADIARRIAVGERKWFEDNVSNDRAQTAFELLVAALERQGGKDIAQRIQNGSKWYGLGTRQLKVPNALTEPDMRKNRRVVFVVRQVTFLPPPPTPPEPPRSIIEDRYTVQLVSATTFTKSVGTGPEILIARLELEIIDKIDKKSARFKVEALGGGVSFGPLSGGISTTSSAGKPVAFKTFRRTADHLDLKAFEGRISVFIDPSASTTAAPSDGGDISIAFDGLQENGANTNPVVIRLDSGASGGTPGLGFGDVAIGHARIVSGPQNL